MSAERERDEAKEETQLTGLAAVVAGDAKALEENKMARVQDALAAAEEARRKVETKAAFREVERTSLFLEIGTTKVGKDKEAMEEDYHKALELIFAYGYGCFVFKHNIYGDQPEVPDGMPDSSDPLPLEFFVNLRCSQAPIATKATTVEAD